MTATQKSIVFIMAIVAVVGGLTFLSTLEPPPNRPNNAEHRLKLNIKGELIGIGSDRPPQILPKKQMEAWVNQRCISCHGLPPTRDIPYQDAPKMLPEHHPPKNTCIKCHRAE